MRRLAENWMPIGKKMDKSYFFCVKDIFRRQRLYKINLDKKLAENISGKS
jgi:hypothetical protein